MFLTSAGGVFDVLEATRRFHWEGDYPILVIFDGYMLVKPVLLSGSSLLSDFGNLDHYVLLFDVVEQFLFVL